MMKFRLLHPLSPYGVVADAHDVHALKSALNHLGYYTPDKYTGIEENREPALFAALRDFQTERGLKPSEYLQPFDETVRALDSALKDLDMQERYIWRTVGDARVRDNHAALEGQIFTWGNPPEPGHPGQDYNCRCWAEVIDKPKKEKKKCFAAPNWVEDAKDFIAGEEGNFDYPYLDSEKIITIGMGCNINKEIEFMAVPFSYEDPETFERRVANQQEKMEGYNALKGERNKLKNLNKAGKFNVSAVNQRYYTFLHVTDDWIQKEFEKRIQIFIRELNELFDQKEFNCYPAPARIALLDMIYVLGARKLRNVFSDFSLAVKRRDWGAAAQESERNGISNTRNQAIFNYLMDAQSEEEASQSD